MKKSGVVEINYFAVFMLFIVLLFFSVLYFTLSANRCKTPFPLTCAGHIIFNNTVMLNLKNSLINDLIIDSLGIEGCNKTTSGSIHSDVIKTFLLEECSMDLINKKKISVRYHLFESELTHTIEGELSSKRSR